MRFSSETKRTLHPQVGLIPHFLWESHDGFNHELPDNILALMQAESADIINQIQRHKIRPYENRGRRCAWLAVALSHPDLNAEYLHQIGCELGMSDNGLFNASAYYGHLEVLRYLEEKSPARFQEIMAAEVYEAFIYAARFGYLNVLRYLERKVPYKLQTMIAGDTRFVFEFAARNGYLEVLRYLEETNNLQRVIADHGYFAFCSAAENGHLEVLRYLEEKAPAKFQGEIAEKALLAFSGTVRNGHIDVLRYLEEKALDKLKLQEMIAKDDYAAFRYAPLYDRLDVLRYLEEKAPDRLQEMIVAGDCDAFCYAAQNGHLEIIRYLEEKAPDRLQEMIMAKNYWAIWFAKSYGHIGVVLHLLTHPVAFAFAEQDQREYGSHVNPFITERLAALYQQKEALEAENPNAVFDEVNRSSVKLLFYMARNLIRRNEAALNDDLLFLLSLPSVKAEAHRTVGRGMPNELIRLALTIGNQRASELLLNIPEVHRLAAQNNFYREEVRNGLDLRLLAQNRESSLTGLSQGEQSRLDAAIARYQPMIKAKGVNHLMAELRAVLLSRYLAHPAEIVRASSEHITLPASWEEFFCLGLMGEDFKAAIKAYAANKDHTAWRYLLKPNPWMHEQASYVYVNPDNHQEKWSSFEEYQPLIGLFYLGACDSGSPPIDGYTIETRLDGFVDELAYIARAHNWDRSRVKVGIEGALLLDKNGRPVEEEYDDLEKDRPSCYSGVKRRLFQSVKGHALFSVLSKETVQTEINEFVREHFQKVINIENNKENGGKIKAAWDKHIAGDDMEPGDWTALKLMDVANEALSQFIDALSIKYGNQFASNPELKELVRHAFVLTKEDDAHVLSFGYLHPKSLFDEAAKNVAGPGSLGLFGQNDEPLSSAPGSLASEPGFSA